MNSTFAKVLQHFLAGLDAFLEQACQFFTLFESIFAQFDGRKRVVLRLFVIEDFSHFDQELCSKEKEEREGIKRISERKRKKEHKNKNAQPLMSFTCSGVNFCCNF